MLGNKIVELRKKGNFFNFNSSNTCKGILRSGKCTINFLPYSKKDFKEHVRLGFPGDTPEEKMKDLKEKIEKTEVKIGVKVGKEGKLFGSVSSKQIADAIATQLNEKIDKRKINLDSPLSTLGAFEIKIDLHKDVVAKIKVFVIEEK